MEVEGNLGVEGNFEVSQPQTEETHEEPSTQVLQLKLYKEDTMHGENPIHEEYPMHEGHPSQEGTSSQGGPHTWFLEYFGKLNETMEKIEQRQEEHAKHFE